MTTATPSPTVQRSPYATLAEAADYTRLSVRTLRRAAKDGRLATHRVGWRVLVDYQALDAFVRGNPARIEEP